LDFDPIFQAIGDFFDNPIIQLALRAVAIYIVVLWLASAYWAFRDLQHRTNNPVLPYVAATLIVLFTPVFFLLGVIIYKLVRPAERIGEVSERQLAEEALLAEVESIRNCPTCHRRVHEEWIICPTCRTRLNRVCPNCGKLVGLDWSLCAWCGKDFERREAAAVGALPPAPAQAAIAPQASARSAGSPAPAVPREAKPRSTGTRSGATLGSPDVLPER
jgi:RNA polymerase subunit RPABC4/transcription elongation factor Spt4